MKFADTLRAVINTKNTIHAAHFNGQRARAMGEAFTAWKHGRGTLESQAFAAGWREKDLRMQQAAQ